MTAPFPPSARLIAALIALAVFASIALQTTLNLERDGSPFVAFASLMRYFTLWTNFGGGLIMGWVAWRGSADERVTFSLVTAFVIVAAVYHVLLAAEHHPVGADWWTNLMFHTIIPASAVLWWLVFSRPSQLGWRSIPVVMAVPVAYTIFAQAVGAATGFYPYFFLDLPRLGWPMLLANLVGLSAVFMLIAALLLTIRRAAVKAYSA